MSLFVAEISPKDIPIILDDMRGWMCPGALSYQTVTYIVIKHHADQEGQSGWEIAKLINIPYLSRQSPVMNVVLII